MNTVLLNTVHLDGAPIIKKVSGEGGGSTILNQSKSVEITENGSVSVTPDAGYTGLSKVDVSVNVPSSDGGSVPSRPTWTGHADAEGLKAIGWTDEDIAYYQENGVNWNAEDDEYHKVTDNNKALYGVLTANNIADYKDRIVYLPKIDTSNVTSMYNMFQGCLSLVGIPQLDTSSVTSMYQMFSNCTSLVSIPQLDTSSVTNMYNMFYGCCALIGIPQLDTSNVTDMYGMFRGCFSLVSVSQLDTSSVTNSNDTFSQCNSLTHVNLKNVKRSFSLNYATLLSKESLLYLINNEAATSAITIKLASYAYTRLAEDQDIVAALTNHPNISLAK